MSTARLIALFAVLPLPALLAFCGLLYLALHDHDAHTPAIEGSGGNDTPPDPRPSPHGGPPLRDARASRTRLRERRRLADRRFAGTRREWCRDSTRPARRKAEEYPVEKLIPDAKTL